MKVFKFKSTAWKRELEYQVTGVEILENTPEMQ